MTDAMVVAGIVVVLVVYLVVSVVRLRRRGGYL